MLTSIPDFTLILIFCWHLLASPLLLLLLLFKFNADGRGLGEFEAFLAHGEGLLKFECLQKFHLPPLSTRLFRHIFGSDKVCPLATKLFDHDIPRCVVGWSRRLRTGHGERRRALWCGTQMGWACSRIIRSAGKCVSHIFRRGVGLNVSLSFETIDFFLH